MAVAKARLITALQPLSVPVKRSALVIGGGVTGMTSALELADQGFAVDIIERTTQLGGMANKLKFSLDGENVPDFVAALIKQVSEHPNIKVYTDTWIVDVTGYVGNFYVDLMRYRRAWQSRRLS